MLNHKDYAELMKPLVDMYNEMEYELIKLIAERFATYDSVGGTLEWQIRKLDELGGLNKDAVKIIASKSQKTEEEINSMLHKAGYKAVPTSEFQNIYESGGVLVNPQTISIAKVLETAQIDLSDAFSLIRTKAIQGTKQAYVDIVNQAYLEVNGGYYSYEESIQKACKKMANRGITCATYKTADGKVRKMDINAVVRRDVLTSITQTANRANEQFTKELGAQHVYVSQHIGARNKGKLWQNHENWQGCVYLLKGSDDKYKNFKDTTGYGKIDGLGGVNCRHIYRAFFPGFSILPKRVSQEENSRVADLREKQRYLERGIRHWKKQVAMCEGLKDEISKAYAKGKVEEWQTRLQELTESHKELKRDYARERV